MKYIAPGKFVWSMFLPDAISLKEATFMPPVCTYVCNKTVISLLTRSMVTKMKLLNNLSFVMKNMPSCLKFGVIFSDLWELKRGQIGKVSQLTYVEI